MVDKTNLSDQEVKSPQVTTDNADLETANVAELLGVVSSAVNKLDGAGLEIVDGEVRVNSDVFDGNIEGLSNPMTADLDASGFNISNAGTIEGQALEADQASVSEGFVYGIPEGSDFSSDGDDLSVSVDDFGDKKRVLIVARFGVINGQTPKIIIDGNDDNANYYVERNDGTRLENNDSLVLCEGTDTTSHITAKLELTASIDSPELGFRPALTHAMVSEGRSSPRFDNPITGGGYSDWIDGNVTIELRDIREGENAELEVFSQ